MNLEDEDKNNESGKRLQIKYKKEELYSDSNLEEKFKEKKNYLNLYYCNLSIGIIFTYIFILCSITINIVNRIIFLQYKFKFNLTLIFLQQFFCMIFFYILSKCSKIFHRHAGKISFNDFYKLKYQYIAYSIFFIIKTINSFLGYQLVTNIPMYVNLRKFLTAMTFIYKYFFKKEKISNINIFVIFLLTLGALLAGIDDYSTDYKGYLAVFLKNTLNLINLEVSENFKKKNGVSNLKLLVYNSFLSTPILFIGIFIKGENKKIKIYFKDNNEFNYFGLYLYIFISCAIILVTNSSFFISNEKNTSLFTQLLSDTKYIVITLISYSVLKTFSFTWKNILGLFISTLAAFIITISTLYNNIQFKKTKKIQNEPEMQKVDIKNMK